MSKNSKINVIAVVGPTASGKTAYSINLAEEIGGEIISADSRLVYKGFDIGTAKPSLIEQEKIRHHMIDIVDPNFVYSAGLYKEQAQSCIVDIVNRGKIPIICGGTGLYIDALLKNFEFPQIEPDYELRAKLSNLSKDELYKYLCNLDPENDIDKNDVKKIIRAIEIVKKTGKRLTSSRGISAPVYNIKWLGLNYERSILYDRINSRVDNMVENGLLEETKNLLDKYGEISNIIDTIGYKEMFMFLTGKLSFNDAIELLKRNTRNYAKRQLTWFRKNPDIEWNIYPEKLKK